MLNANTLIVSDIHLGSNYSRTDELMFILHSWSFERLILLGDIFESLNLKDFSNNQLELVSLIRSLSSETEVVWIEGNHDEGISKIAPLMLGINVYKQYRWEYNGEYYLAIHGHQFDDFIRNNEKLMKLIYYFHRLIQDFEYNTGKLSRYLLQRSSSWFNLSDKVAQYAIDYAIKSGSKNIFCGHTHEVMSLSLDEVNYYNTGSWTDSPSSYISINVEGIKIHELN